MCFLCRPNGTQAPPSNQATSSAPSAPPLSGSSMYPKVTSPDVSWPGEPSNGSQPHIYTFVQALSLLEQPFNEPPLQTWFTVLSLSQISAHRCMFVCRMVCNAVQCPRASTHGSQQRRWRHCTLGSCCGQPTCCQPERQAARGGAAHGF